MSGNTPYASFEAGRAHVEELLNHHRILEPAYNAARQLARQYPREVQVHFLLNLVTCLSGLGGGARYASHILDDARRCPDFDCKVNGDMQRDRVIGLIRFAHGTTDHDLNLAEAIIPDVQSLHAGDLNRLACMRDVNGRLLYARRRYANAAREHEAADAAWAEIGELADPIWVYNNKVHWLKAVVATGGRNGPLAHRLERDIRTGRPPKSRDRGPEARVIRGLPLGFGNRVHDWVTSHR